MADLVGNLEVVHERLTSVGGHLLEVQLSDLDALFTTTEWEVTVSDIAWQAPSSMRQRNVGDQIVVTLPEPLDRLDGYGDATTTAWIAVGDDNELYGVGVLNSSGAFEHVSYSDYTFMLAAGAKALPNETIRFRVQVGFCADPFVPPTFESEPAALVAFFDHLDNRPRSQGDLLQQASAIEASVGGLTDPLTGHVSAPDLNDLIYQLETGVAEDELVLRPAIPLLIRLDPNGLPIDETPTPVVAFTALPSNRVLGWMFVSSIGVVEEDGTVTPGWDMIKFIAPPEPDETVAVHLRPDHTDGVACIYKENPEPLLAIPYDAIAGSTRVIIDLATATFETTTELPLG